MFLEKNFSKEWNTKYDLVYVIYKEKKKLKYSIPINYIVSCKTCFYYLDTAAPETRALKFRF